MIVNNYRYVLVPLQRELTSHNTASTEEAANVHDDNTLAPAVNTAPPIPARRTFISLCARCCKWCGAVLALVVTLFVHASQFESFLHYLALPRALIIPLSLLRIVCVAAMALIAMKTKGNLAEFLWVLVCFAVRSLVTTSNPYIPYLVMFIFSLVVAIYRACAPAVLPLLFSMICIVELIISESVHTARAESFCNLTFTLAQHTVCILASIVWRLCARERLVRHRVWVVGISSTGLLLEVLLLAIFHVSWRLVLLAIIPIFMTLPFLTDSLVPWYCALSMLALAVEFPFTVSHLIAFICARDPETLFDDNRMLFVVRGVLRIGYIGVAIFCTKRISRWLWREVPRRAEGPGIHTD